MAKKAKSTFNYKEEVTALKTAGPERLYLLYGPEDYLRERYLEELKQICVPDGAEFSYKRLNGPSIDLSDLSEAVNALPFFTERTLVELRDYDINHCRDEEAERLKAILGDIPDYCTVVFVVSSSYDIDGRLSAAKLLKKLGRAIEFTEQEGNALTQWVASRFRALGKQISREDIEHLIFLSGNRMNSLISEIEKLAAHAAGEIVTREEIDAVASRVPEADVFRMAELLSLRDVERAAAILSNLLTDKDNHPIKLNALIANQMRRLYAVKIGLDAGKARKDVMDLAGIRFDSIFDKLAASARRYSTEQLGKIVTLCADYDFRMKSTGLDAYDLMIELFARIAAGV
ncbi:MAG: DNA polymerase III subunit delta [Clostridia bacterium]|nr:DNA polymerase III subunit delta [Clostridia bacterium]